MAGESSLRGKELVQAVKREFFGLLKCPSDSLATPSTSAFPPTRSWNNGAAQNVLSSSLVSEDLCLFSETRLLATAIHDIHFQLMCVSSFSLIFETHLIHSYEAMEYNLG